MMKKSGNPLCVMKSKETCLWSLLSLYFLSARRLGHAEVMSVKGFYTGMLR